MAIVSIAALAVVVLDRLIAFGSAKRARTSALVYALSALITMLGGYWFLSSMFYT